MSRNDGRDNDAKSSNRLSLYLFRQTVTAIYFPQYHLFFQTLFRNDYYRSAFVDQKLSDLDLFSQFLQQPVVKLLVRSKIRLLISSR